MTRLMDRILIGAGVLLVLVLIVRDVHAIVRTRGELNTALRSARGIQRQADENNLPNIPRDASKRSGRALEAWEKLPLADASLDAWDFYPDPGRRP